MKVKHEIEMTIAAYQTLYESSVAFGIRKALQAELTKDELEEQVSPCMTWQPMAYSNTQTKKESDKKNELKLLEPSFRHFP